MLVEVTAASRRETDDYVIKIMSTYSGFTYYPSQKVFTRSFANILSEANMAQLKYNIIFTNHFKYCGFVDDHNNLRHSKPSLEETWVTQLWSNRVFSFILTVSEVNFYLMF